MVRDYQPSDLPEIIALHKAQGFDYSLGDLSNPLFFVKKVRVVDGRIVAAMALRLTCETFLLVNPEDSPIVKFDSMIELQPEVLSEAYQKGIDDVVAVIPPEILKKFHKRLIQLGWSEDREWKMFSRSTRNAECPAASVERV